MYCVLNLQHVQIRSTCTIHLSGLVDPKWLSITLGTVLHLPPKHGGSIGPEKQTLMKVEMLLLKWHLKHLMCLKRPQFPTSLFALIKERDFSESSPCKAAGKMKLYNPLKWKLTQKKHVNRINA